MHCLVIDEHPVTLLGLRLIIKTNFPDWLITTATSTHDATECIRTFNGSGQPIGLVLLGLGLHDHDGITFLTGLQQDASTRSILSIVISGLNDEKTIVLCKKLGVHGYIQKNKETSEIIQAIQTVCSGGEYFCRSDVARAGILINSINLTSRQRDLIDLLLAGHSNKMIAYTLNLSYGTVKNYMFDLMRLLSVKSRLELVMKIRESGYQSRTDICPDVTHCVRCEYAFVNDSPDACEAYKRKSVKQTAL